MQNIKEVSNAVHYTVDILNIKSLVTSMAST